MLTFRMTTSKTRELGGVLALVADEVPIKTHLVPLDSVELSTLFEKEMGMIRSGHSKI